MFSESAWIELSIGCEQLALPENQSKPKVESSRIPLSGLTTLLELAPTLVDLSYIVQTRTC